jgi:hypothetical protein
MAVGNVQGAIRAKNPISAGGALRGSMLINLLENIIVFSGKLYINIIEVINGQYKRKRRIRKKAVQDKRSWEVNEPSNDFDLKYGVDTMGAVSFSKSDIKCANRIYCADYHRSSPGLIKFILSHLHIEYSIYTFIDVGCGKGMPLLVAGDFPFRQIVGIEFSPELCEIARRNIQVLRDEHNKCHNASVICINATDVRFPDSSLVFLMFNPFKAKVMKKILHAIMKSYQSNPRDIIVIYLHPVYENVFSEFPSFEKIMEDIQFSIYRMEAKSAASS